MRSRPPDCPAVTGIWFHSHQSETVTLAPISIPVGMMNMFTTVCSKPCAKKTEIGSHAPTSLPMVEDDVMAMTTPRQTSQLHSIALTKAVIMPAAPSAS